MHVLYGVAERHADFMSLLFIAFRQRFLGTDSLTPCTASPKRNVVQYYYIFIACLLTFIHFILLFYSTESKQIF